MKLRFFTTRRMSLILIIFFCGTALTWACSVPVFRYALEKWRTDPYEVLLFYKGELPADLKSWTDRFGRKNLPEDETANIRIKAINLDDKPHADLVTIWKDQKTEQLPWMVIRYPIPLPNLYQGPATEKVLTSLVDSPARRKISEKILKGKTAVWVLLESGDKKKDDEAWKILNTELRVAEETLELPEISEADIAEGLVSVDPDQLELSFASIRLSRDVPEEKMFVEMLLGSESDLKELDGAMAFPVFGRGRLLYALVDAGINPKTILETCDALIGECTCEVKEQNPGVDLVMSVDWENLVKSQIEIDESIAPLTSLSSLTVSREEVETKIETEVAKDIKGVEVKAVENKTETSESEIAKTDPAKTGSAEANTALSEKAPKEKTEEKANPDSDLLNNTLGLLALFAACVMGISYFVMRKNQMN